MSFTDGILNGFKSYWDALVFIIRNGLWYYVIFPIAVAAGLYILGYYSLFAFSSFISETTRNWISGTGISSAILSFFASVLLFLIREVLKPFFMIIFGAVLKYVLLIICSPIMAQLSERTEEIVTGNKFPFSFSQFIRNFLRSLLVILRNLSLQLLITIAGLALIWIPVIGWLVFPFLLIINWYFLGFNLMDYTYERKKLSISSGAAFTRKNKWLAITHGFLYSMLILIPFAGIIISTVLAPVATTLTLVKESDKK